MTSFTVPATQTADHPDLPDGHYLLYARSIRVTDLTVEIPALHAIFMWHQKWRSPQAYTVGHSRDRTAPVFDNMKIQARLDRSTAREMLKTDFEQAFVVHNDYRASERDLFKLSLKILAFPGVIAGALLSAKLISSSGNLAVVLQIPFIWLALIIAGILNTIVVRSYVATDRVQTEAKHQVNRLRML